MENVVVSKIEVGKKIRERRCKILATIKPSAMNTVTSAINVTIPHALEAHQDIAGNARSRLFQLVGERNSRLARNAMERSKWPLVLRPILRCNNVRVMSGVNDPARESFQIRFRAASLGIAAANENDRQWFVRPQK